MSAPSGPQSTSSTPPPATPPGATFAGPPPAGSAPSAAAAPVPGGPPDTDWTDQVTDLIVDSVDKVRARTTGPILEGAKGAVYAIVALVILLPILALGTIGLVRLLNWAIPGDVWIVYALLGIICLIVGVVFWSKRGKPAT